MGKRGETLEQLNADILKEKAQPYITSCKERVLQIGEGNFLRGFIDWMIHQLNKEGIFNGKVVAIQPTPNGKVVPKLNKQDGLYTTILRGIRNGETIEETEINQSISRGINPYKDWKSVLKVAESQDIEFVFSNTTEAGLTYVKEDFDINKSPLSFPGKLTALLYHRFKVLGSGLVIIPCELVENNGEVLRDLIIKIAKDWDLPEAFIDWVKKENSFCNTLVDRIVTGYPKDEVDYFHNLLGYEDVLMTTAEPFHLFVIDGMDEIKERLPFHKVGLNVHWGDVTYYRNLKVGLLNSTHTLSFAAGVLTGIQTVYEGMKDKTIRNLIYNGLYGEILLLFKADQDDARAFADSVIERFENPFIKHQLVDLGLNATNKFKTRILPLLKTYQDTYNKLPIYMVFSLTAIIAYYRFEKIDGPTLIGNTGERAYVIRDNEEVLSLFYQEWSRFDGTEKSVKRLIKNVLSSEVIWGEDLTKINGLDAVVSEELNIMLSRGVKSSIESLSKRVWRYESHKL